MKEQDIDSWKITVFIPLPPKSTQLQASTAVATPQRAENVIYLLDWDPDLHKELELEERLQNPNQPNPETTSQNRSTEHRIWPSLLFTSTSQASNPAASWVGNPLAIAALPQDLPQHAWLLSGGVSHKSQQQHLSFLDGVLPVMSPKDIFPTHTTIPRHCEFGYTVNRKTGGMCLMENFIVTRGREET